MSGGGGGLWQQKFTEKLINVPVLLTNDDQLPRSDDRLPTNNDQLPRSDDRLSTNDDQLPRNDDRLSTNDGQLPRSDDRNVSFYRQAIELPTVFGKSGGCGTPTPSSSASP